MDDISRAKKSHKNLKEKYKGEVPERWRTFAGFWSEIGSLWLQEKRDECWFNFHKKDKNKPLSLENLVFKKRFPIPPYEYSARAAYNAIRYGKKKYVQLPSYWMSFNNFWYENHDQWEAMRRAYPDTPLTFDAVDREAPFGRLNVVVVIAGKTRFCKLTPRERREEEERFAEIREKKRIRRHPLHEKWKSVRKIRSPEWDRYEKFYEDTIEKYSAITVNKTETVEIRRHDLQKPHSPENTFFRARKKNESIIQREQDEEYRKSYKKIFKESLNESVFGKPVLQKIRDGDNFIWINHKTLWDAVQNTGEDPVTIMLQAEEGDYWKWDEVDGLLDHKNDM